MSRPRVAIVCRGCGEGGSVAAVALRQAAELTRHFSVSVISDSFDARAAVPFETRLIAPRSYGFLRRMAHVPNEVAFARAARAELLRLRPSFAIAHSHAVAYFAAKALRATTGAPIALVTHGDIFDRPRGTYDARLTAFYAFVTPRAYRSADTVVALSPYMAEMAIRGGADAAAVVVIPNGIDPGDVGLPTHPSPRTVSTAAPLRLLYVGRLSVEKGIDHLVDASALLAERGVVHSLDVVGDGPLAARLRERCAGRQEIHFVGRRERALLGEHYLRADVVCIPSLSEALAGVALEALAAGVPVVATDTGGNRFLVRDGENGCLVAPGNSIALADAIQRLDSDRGLLQKLTDQAGSTVASFTWEETGRRLRELIDERLAAPSLRST